MKDTSFESRGLSVEEFAVENGPYYAREFARIQGKTGFAWSWNAMAAICGPLWGAARGAWGFFWMFLVLELFALVQIGRGLWGELGAEHLVRYERLLTNIAKREAQAADLTAAGDAAGAAAKLKIADNLRAAADKALEAANAANSTAIAILLTGLALMVAIKLAEGFYANTAFEAQYLRWRSGQKAQSGMNRSGLIFGAIGLLAIWPLTLVRFTVAKPDEAMASVTGGLLGERLPITEFPVGREYFAALSKKGDAGFDWLANNFGNVFDGVTAGIRWVLDGLEVLLIQTPWPVVMFVTVIMALRLAGPRVAIFTAASLAYLAFMGLWELAMITVALIGAGAFLCVAIGIPLGIWFGKSKRAYAIAEPVLDFMQTMPAFVYLIPIIAFFGTGKPPGVLATLIFAMPPVIRLTALGMRGVPETTKEAAVAFGCSRRQLLLNVELPLALPSIMTGINQTILMSLSMVVIASLIGAEGLGALILEALQYAAKGQGLLGGLAILLCAMVIDRIAQGAYRRRSGEN
ncbi:ABC transporter permease subunit [Leisingera sp. HS039]|uniref:ABC transporter permease n=1 Tax=unclassified Leisingera TaxID=2614906 RepID=UPI001070BF72|nr:MULTISPECIES: ABC transporter permease subunit [unclassified Leisingera]MBQ4826604.1 ABC transporter permease subunit [Leisingera sp. HS039]QBR34937.1 ABC transporter permease subunit [Leisingera sp. NJS201]